MSFTVFGASCRGRARRPMQAGGTRVTRQEPGPRAPRTPLYRRAGPARDSMSSVCSGAICLHVKEYSMDYTCIKKNQRGCTAAEHTPPPGRPGTPARLCGATTRTQFVCSGLSHRSTGREEMPARKVTSPPEAPVPARFCTGRRRGAPARATVSRLAQRPAESSRPVPTFRSNRPDRAEPSQHAPPLPVGPTARLGPSARRRAEAL